MTRAALLLAALAACCALTACGGGDEPVPDHVCLVEGKPMPPAACH